MVVDEGRQVGREGGSKGGSGEQATSPPTEKGLK